MASGSQIQNLPPTFLLLQQEGYLIRSTLTNGLTELRSAHVHNRGSFYSALFNLTVGIERLLKVVVIIDHMLKNKMAVLSKKQLQARSHNIVTLYDECQGIAQMRGLFLPSRAQLDAIDVEFVNLLSDFATKNRYYNLDSLSAPMVSSDPLTRLDRLLEGILCQDVSQRQKNRILSEAGLCTALFGGNTLTLMVGLRQNPLNTQQAISLPGLHEQSVRYAVLRLVKLLAPIKELIEELSHAVYGAGPVPAIPQMHEFLDWLWDNREYVLRKRKWN